MLTSALGNELCPEAENQPLAHARLLEKRSPTLAQFVCAFKLDLSSDLEVFLSSNDLIWVVRTRVQLSKDLVAGFMAVLVNQPSWTFRKPVCLSVSL